MFWLYYYFVLTLKKKILNKLSINIIVIKKNRLFLDLSLHLISHIRHNTVHEIFFFIVKTLIFTLDVDLVKKNGLVRVGLPH